MATVIMTRWPFVGRRAELERFVDALQGGQHDAVVVSGMSGVGKSRLAEECLDYAQAQGRSVTHVRVTESSAVVPLSALAPILPDRVDLTEPHALFAAVRRRVRERGDGMRLVLGIDDVQLLDPASRALLAFLLADNAVFVVATQRMGAMPDALQPRYSDGRALQIPLRSFDRTTVETLLHVALGGPLTAAAVEALWRACQGNVLYLRELVLRALADGVLAEADGVWRFTGLLAGSAGVAELVSSRLRDLSPAQRSVMELLALCEPISVSELLRHTGLEVLIELEERGLIALHDRDRRQEITLTHPLHARVLQAWLSRLHSRSILLAQAERVEGHGARRRGDPLTIASWRLDATGTADPQLLLRAATLARYAHDMAHTRRLAEAVLRHGTSERAGVVLADALAQLGRFAEAEAAYADAAPRSAGRALNLYQGLGDHIAAQHLLDDANPADPEVVAVTALIRNASGRTQEALRLLAERPPQGDRRIGWHRARSESLLAAGRLAEAAAAAQAAFDEYAKTDDRIGLPHPAQYLSTMAEALLEQGRFDEAQRAADQAQSLALADEAPSGLAWSAWVLGRVALARGHPRSAERWFREAAASGDAYPSPPALLLARAGLALAAAWRDRPGEGPNLPGPEDPTLTTWHGDLPRAAAWTLARGGRISEACQVLRAAAEVRRAAGRYTDAVVLLHDALRLGDLGVAGPLVELSARVDGELADARAAHASAARRRDARALEDTAKRFHALGADLYAAETLTGAADLLRADGAARAANALQVRAAGLLERCEDALTPALRTQAGPAPLSPREREVALLAARGVRSREIAAQLTVSVRTVDSHLQNIFAKLGVSGRAELTAFYLRAEQEGQDR